VNALVGPINLLKSFFGFLRSQGWMIEPLFPSSQLIPDGFDIQAAGLVAFGPPSIKNLTPAAYQIAGGQLIGASHLNDVHQQAGMIDVERLSAWAIPTLRSLAALLIVGFLLIWLLPEQLSYSVEQARKSFWRSLFTGLLVWVFGWILVILLTLLTLGLAIFFYWISLPNLAFLIGAFGLGSIGVAVSIFFISIVFVSKIIFATMLGKLFFTRFIPKHAGIRVWPFLTGVILYVLVASIPYLGFLVATFATLVGLGALWTVVSPRKLPKVETEVPVQPAEASPEANLRTE